MRRIALLISTLAACSIPNTQFAPSPDGGGGDGGSDVLSIVASTAGVTVDENDTKQFTVALSHAPATPLSVRIETESSRVGIDLPQLEFNEANFAQPQTITLTGLDDDDVADELASVTLSATDLETVTIATTVRDLDVLALVTNIASNNTITVDEGQSVNVSIRLSHRPSSDVTVMAILPNGPISVTNGSLVFTADNFNVDQTMRFNAAVDANITTDNVLITLRMGTVDRQYTVVSVDKDVLNIQASPSALTITEQGSDGTISVALTQMPSANVIVTIAIGSGHITTVQSQLTFTPMNYDDNQTITVRAPGDTDVEDDSDTITLSTSTPGVMSRTINVTVEDNDSQEILEDVPGTLAVAENGDATFNVTLKFKPTGMINVSVSSLAGGIATAMPGVLSFDENNYNVPKPVTVHGTNDSDLANEPTTIRLSNMAIGMTDVPVMVTDDDEQRLVVSTTNLSVPEGTTGTVNVSLMFQPATTVNAQVTNTNATALPSNPSMLTFTTSDWNQAHPITITPPIDTNAVSETGTLTIMGAGATNTPSVSLTAMDGTVVQTWGWPTPFSGTLQVPQGFVVAYKVAVGAVANLSTFHTYVPAAAGTFKMALYTDVGDLPAQLVPGAEMLLPKALVNGVNNSNALAMPPLLDAPNYWLVIRFSQANAIGYAPAGQTGRQCLRNVNIPDINSPWPANFGSASCTTDRLFNIWITTYHQ